MRYLLYAVLLVVVWLGLCTAVGKWLKGNQRHYPRT